MLSITKKTNLKKNRIHFIFQTYIEFLMAKYQKIYRQKLIYS